MPPAVPPIAELYQALKDAQLEVARREEAERKMQEQINDLRNVIEQMKTAESDGKPRRNRRKKAREPPPCDTEVMTALAHIGFDDMKVHRLGKMYMAIGEPWILPQADMALNQPRPDLDFNDPRRYRTKTPEEGLPYIIAEIYHYVPEEYHTLLERYAPFKEAFARGYGSMRTIAINNMKSVASTVFNVNAAWMVRKTTAINRAEEPAILRYLKWDPTILGGPACDTMPPVLFPNCIRDPRRFMQNPQLVRLLSSILWGETSALTENVLDLPDIQASGAPQPRRGAGPPTNAALWGLKKVTPGLIALGAIGAIFLLSADEEFAPVGAISKINYWERFQDFKKTLAVNQTEGSTAETFKFYQERLFPHEAQDNESFDELEPEEDPADAMIREIMAADAEDLAKKAGARDDPMHSSTRGGGVPSDRTVGDGHGGRRLIRNPSGHSGSHSADNQARTRMEALATASDLSRPRHGPIQNNPRHLPTAQPAIPPPSAFHQTVHARFPQHNTAPSTYPRQSTSYSVKMDDAGVRAPEFFNVDDAYDGYGNTGNTSDEYDNDLSHNPDDDEDVDVEENEVEGVYVQNTPDHSYGEDDEGARGDTQVNDSEESSGEQDVVSYVAAPTHVSQSPEVSIIVEEPDEAFEEDYDEVEYIEVDDDDHTDHGMGPPTDSSDGEQAPIRSCRGRAEGMD
ncbi:hypothetical protein BN946_scf185016.g47 [Trametes cinnabarina]|uniref:Uncharacterized protein n=1 Tax=Pycnoporus cinnabarinus TaxID=5643 RepID=A0A060SHN1_PYCCI|nr:hypothetical protein BN946_scf185016.g47 [Trametes cinnabarina]